MSCIYSVFKEQCRAAPHKIAIFAEGQGLSYQDLDMLVTGWGFLLVGTLKGQRPRVALVTASLVQGVAVTLAVARLQGSCHPLNGQLTTEQLSLGCKMTDSNIVIHDQGQRGQVSDLGGADLCLIATERIHEAFRKARSSPWPEPLPWPWEDDFLLTLSSGSTGDPKPIVVSQRVKLLRARQTQKLYNIDATDVVLCASPYFHSLGQRLVFVALMAGATLVHLPRFTPSSWVATVARYRVSFTIAVASHLYALQGRFFNKGADLQSLKTLVSSSAPMDADFKGRLFEAISCDFHEIYGATEIAIATNLYPTDPAGRHGTVGRVCKGVEIQIVDRQGKPVAANIIGEIACTTPLMFEGYYNRPQLTESSFAGDYFLTGDLGIMDNDGFVSYVSRKKDVIISGGSNVYPQDIEAVLGRHREVNEISVIGVADTLLGEVIIAICVAPSGPRLEQELRQLATRHLASFQRPLQYFFQSSLPLTPSGKVSKKDLRHQYQGLKKDWSQGLRMLLYGE